MEQAPIIPEHEGAGDNTVHSSISDASLEWDPLGDGEYDLTTHPADHFTWSWSRFPDFNQNTPTTCEGCSKSSSFSKNCIECSINIWRPNYPNSFYQTSFDDDFDEYKSCTSGDEYYSCDSDEDEWYIQHNTSETQRVMMDFKTGMAVQFEVRLNDGCFVHGTRKTKYPSTLNNHCNGACNQITLVPQKGIKSSQKNGNEDKHVQNTHEESKYDTPTILKSDTPLFTDRIYSEEVNSDTTADIPISWTFNQNRLFQKLQDPLENAANVYSNYNLVSISPSGSETSEILEEPHYIVYGPKSHDYIIEDGEFVLNDEYNDDQYTCMDESVFDNCHGKYTTNIQDGEPWLEVNQIESKTSSIQTYVFGIIDRKRSGTDNEEGDNRQVTTPNITTCHLDDSEGVPDAVSTNLMIKTSGQLPCDSDFDSVYMALDPSRKTEKTNYRYEDFRRDETMCDSVSSSNTDRTTNTSYPSDENERDFDCKSDNSVQSPTSSMDDNDSSEDTVTVAEQSELSDRMIENKTVSFYDIDFVLGSESVVTRVENEENQHKSLGIYNEVSKRISSLQMFENSEDSSSCGEFDEDQESQLLFYEETYLENVIDVYVTGVLSLAKESLYHDLEYAESTVQTNEKQRENYLGSKDKPKSINKPSGVTEDVAISIEMVSASMNNEHFLENIDRTNLSTDTTETPVAIELTPKVNTYDEIPSTSLDTFTTKNEKLKIITEIDKGNELKASSDIEIPNLKHRDSAECRSSSSKVNNVTGYELTAFPAKSKDTYKSSIGQSCEQNTISEIHDSDVNRITRNAEMNFSADAIKCDIGSIEYTPKRFKSSDVADTTHMTLDLTSRRSKGNDKLNDDGSSRIKTRLKLQSEPKKILQKKVIFLETQSCYEEFDKKPERPKEKSKPEKFNLTELSSKHGKEHVLSTESFDTVKQLLDTLLSTLDSHEVKHNFAMIKRHLCKNVIPSLKQKPNIRKDKRSKTEIMRAKVRRTILYITLQTLKKAGKPTHSPSYIGVEKTREGTACYLWNYPEEYQINGTDWNSPKVHSTDNSHFKCQQHEDPLIIDIGVSVKSDNKKNEETWKRINSVQMYLQNSEDLSSCVEFDENEESQLLSYEDKYLENVTDGYVSGVLSLAKESLYHDLEYAESTVQTYGNQRKKYLRSKDKPKSINKPRGVTEDVGISKERVSTSMNTEHFLGNIDRTNLSTDTTETSVAIESTPKVNTDDKIPSTSLDEFTTTKGTLNIITEIDEGNELKASFDIEIPTLKHRDSAECRNLSSKVNNVTGYELTAFPAKFKDTYKSSIGQSCEQNKISEIHDSDVKRITRKTDINFSADGIKSDIGSIEYTPKRLKSSDVVDTTHMTLDLTSRRSKGNDKLNDDGSSRIKTCIKPLGEPKKILQKKVCFLETQSCYEEFDKKPERPKEKSIPEKFNLIESSSKHGKEHVLSTKSFDTVKQLLDTLLSTLDSHEVKQTFAMIKRHLCKNVIPSLKQKPNKRKDKRSETEIMRAKVRRTILYITLQTLKKAGKLTPSPSYIDIKKTSEGTASYLWNYPEEYQINGTDWSSQKVHSTDNSHFKCQQHEDPLIIDIGVSVKSDNKKNEDTRKRVDSVQMYLQNSEDSSSCGEFDENQESQLLSYEEKCLENVTDGYVSGVLSLAKESLYHDLEYSESTVQTYEKKKENYLCSKDKPKSVNKPSGVTEDVDISIEMVSASMDNGHFLENIDRTNLSTDTTETSVAIESTPKVNTYDEIPSTSLDTFTRTKEKLDIIIEIDKFGVSMKSDNKTNEDTLKLAKKIEQQTETRKETAWDVKSKDHVRVPEYKTVDNECSMYSYPDSQKLSQRKYIPKNLKVLEAMKREEEAFEELEKKVTSLYDRFMSKRSSPKTDSTEAGKKIEKRNVSINTKHGTEINSMCPCVTVKQTSCDNLAADYIGATPTDHDEISSDASFDNIAMQISNSRIPTQSSSSSTNISSDSSFDNLAVNIASAHQRRYKTENDTGSLDSAYLSMSIDDIENTKYRLDGTSYGSKGQVSSAIKNSMHQNDKCDGIKMFKNKDKVPKTYTDDQIKTRVHSPDDGKEVYSDPKDTDINYISNISKEHNNKTINKKAKEVKRGSFQNLKVNVKSFIGRFSSKDEEGYLEKFHSKKHHTTKGDPKHVSESQGYGSSSPNGKASKRKEYLEQKEQKNKKSILQYKTLPKDSHVFSSTPNKLVNFATSELTDQGSDGVRSVSQCHGDDTGEESGKDECLEIDVDNLFEKTSSESLKAGIDTHGRLFNNNINISSAQRNSIQSLKELNIGVTTLVEQFNSNEDEVKTFLPVAHPKGAKFKRVITTPRGCST